MSRNLSFSKAIFLIGFFVVGCMVATAQEPRTDELTKSVAQLESQISDSIDLIRHAKPPRNYFSTVQQSRTERQNSRSKVQEQPTCHCVASDPSADKTGCCPTCRDRQECQGSCPALQQVAATKKDEIIPIPPGFKAVAVKVSVDDTINGLLQPGDYVDVIGVFKTIKSGETVSVSQTILKKIKVFCVDVSDQPEYPHKSNIVGLLVDEPQSDRLVKAQKVAKLKLALRGGEESLGEVVPMDERLLLPLSETRPAVASTRTPGFIQNKHFESPAYGLCDELAATMSECLADSSMSEESRRRILETTMKLLVRNAELEAHAEMSRLQLQHERELSAMKGDLMHLQAQITAVGEIKTWMGPLYTNQNQTQQQMNNLMTNLQLVNRTLRLLEKEKDVSKRMQANRPLPSQFVPSTQPQQPQPNFRPERWSQLPSHIQPQPQTQPRFQSQPQPQVRPSTERDDRTTGNPLSPKSDTVLSSITSQVAPPRLTDEAIRRQQLENHMRQLQVELDRSRASSVQPAGWEQAVPQSYPNQLRPQPANQLRPLPAKPIPSSVQRR